MRVFDLGHIAERLLSKDIVNQVSSIHEYRGQQNLLIESKADILQGLLKVAKIQSTASSNRIEGIRTSDKRIARLVQEKIEPKNRDESEIAGYRDVLATIHENYDDMPPRPSIILQLHRDLYAYSGSSIGGRFKNTDNRIEEIDAEGNAFVRFQPISAFETPMAMDDLYESFKKEIGKGDFDPLILIPPFILDFLCIHPFNDGNGRMSRLLTLLLLHRSGYIAGKYISIEMLIEKTKDTYYDALRESSGGWHDGQNDYKPFTGYLLGVILAAYKEFGSRVAYLTTKGISKTQRIEEVLRNNLGKMKMVEIQAVCPDISHSTITKTLNALQNSGKVKKLRGGRYAEYIWNRNT